jgi:hypothetical protein
MVETPTSAKINFNFAFIQMIPKYAIEEFLQVGFGHA